MSIFTQILDKLGLHKKQPAGTGTSSTAGKPTPTGTSTSTPSNPATTGTTTTGSTSNRPATTTPAAKPASTTGPTGAAPTSEHGVRTSAGAADRRQQDDMAVKHDPAAMAAAPVAPKPMAEVDVMKMLEQKAKGTGLNWKQSISDLLFLLDIDNSREARTELAKELGAPADVMSDSARMNTWLHKTVLRKIAENGGNIPQDLLD